jgi:hypothetical protein
MGHGIQITPYGGENSRKQVLPGRFLLCHGRTGGSTGTADDSLDRIPRVSLSLSWLPTCSPNR